MVFQVKTKKKYLKLNPNPKFCSNANTWRQKQSRNGRKTASKANRYTYIIRTCFYLCPNKPKCNRMKSERIKIWSSIAPRSLAPVHLRQINIYLWMLSCWLRAFRKTVRMQLFTLLYRTFFFNHVHIYMFYILWISALVLCIESNFSGLRIV